MVLIMPLMVISVILKVIFTNRFLTRVIYNNSRRILIARSDFLSASYSNPPVVVLLSSSVKLPVKFVSDIPMPLAHPPSWILPITMISPLTYPTDFLRMGYLCIGFPQPYFTLAVKKVASTINPWGVGFAGKITNSELSNLSGVFELL
jgi:hypothetical protein